MPNNCYICYNKNTNEILKCRQCENNVCDVCFANTIANNENSMIITWIIKVFILAHIFNNVFNSKTNNYDTNDN